MTGTEIVERAGETLPAEAAHSTAGLMQVIERAAMDPDFDVEKLDKLLDVKERWDREEARKAYFAALARAQANMPIVNKNRHVKFKAKSGGADTDYWHADYGNLIETVKPHLTAEGLSHDHDVRQDGNMITVECILSHEQGHSKSVVMTAPPDNTGGKNQIQQIKSSVTYLKRATFEAVTGAATEDGDDDGRGAYQDDTISVSQVAWLNAEIEQVGADRAAFLNYLGVAELEYLLVADFAKATRAIEAKRAKLAQEQSNAEAAAQEAG